ncbi:MAG TPA: 3-phosphoserine/phosphohydroxythreonine transaminase [Candidatus Avacidaminococcus intestinavium]|uniref:Phosphoserine aminotransferase n=1 Tax=Candidatus Avacidaminococcus intestinavium TaxID=2840684 RepID=A0A9D1MPY5_9FIRM|nr:3-phosphoserine/phosphohydroxythreonine transaminase [Candidatus Avacidaminococcus intestinavium]
MRVNRIFNFNAGPAVLPLEVLEEVQNELINYKNSGMSILEMSHRSSLYETINVEAENDIKELLGLDDEYCVLFMGGGASTQFSMVPLNFLSKEATAGYIITSTFSEKAVQEAEKIGKTQILFSSKEHRFNRVPRPEEIVIDQDLAYVHLTGNNTIEGTEFFAYPQTGKVPLIADLSSDILSKPIEAKRFSLIYAGAQKNIGPGGVTVIIARKSFLAGRSTSLPTMLNYEVHMDNNSLYNTPPVFGVYIIAKVVKWLKNQGGLIQILNKNKEKAQIIYNVIDDLPEFYQGYADVSSRSLMNITFGLPNENLEKKFVEEAEHQGMVGLQGHRSVGGLRASIYNAMTLDGCSALASFMKDFYLNNR